MNSIESDRVDAIGLLAINVDKMDDVELHRAYEDSWINEGEGVFEHALRLNTFINGLRIAATSKVNDLGELGKKSIDDNEALFDNRNAHLKTLFNFLVTDIDSGPENNSIQDLLRKHIAQVDRDSVDPKDTERLINVIEFCFAVRAKSLFC